MMGINCDYASEMMGKVLAQKFWKPAAAQNIGACLGFEKGRSESSLDWSSGAKQEPAQKWNYVFRPRLRMESRDMAIDSGRSVEVGAMASVPSMIRILAVDDHPLL